ncbi:MAG: RdgB/HAM1 family non-canonical purine NTP pyrophosphatase [Armatimonadetes bacterium]|nr:RdgB/HAM1 family non-canonical purine NTP pyrophosphatase [Armatimonadota bacterium]
MTETGPGLRRELVVATGNPGKCAEMEQILQGCGIRILTMAHFPGEPFDPEETGCTYMENAEIKALAACRITGRVCVADDAGLEIDALDGAPGVYSRRFLGEETPFPAKMVRILEMLRHVPDEQRGCRFRAAVAIATPDGRTVGCHGVCEGRIAREQRGAFGFGYDPIFFVPALGRHMAELPPEIKHGISHRGQALACAKLAIADLFGPA